MSLVEAVAWVGSRGPEVFRRAQIAEGSDVEPGQEVSRGITKWLCLDQDLLNSCGRNYNQVAEELFDRAYRGELKAIGRRGQTARFEDIPAIDWVGGKLNERTDAFIPAGCGMFDEGWIDVGFHRAEVEKLWPSEAPPPAPISRTRKESDGLKQLRLFLPYASKKDWLVSHTGPQLFDEYGRWCAHRRVKPLDRSTFLAKLKDYREGRWS